MTDFLQDERVKAAREAMHDEDECVDPDCRVCNPPLVVAAVSGPHKDTGRFNALYAILPFEMQMQLGGDSDEAREGIDQWPDGKGLAVSGPARTPEGEPEPLREGNWYQTLGGEWVQVLAIGGLKGYETAVDAEGIHRYAFRDIGRVTGTDHTLPDSRNFVKLYRALPAARPQGTATCPCGALVLAAGHNCASCVVVLERNASPPSPGVSRADVEALREFPARLIESTMMAATENAVYLLRRDVLALFSPAPAQEGR